MSSLSIYAERSFVALDEATQSNLELLSNLQDGSRKYSLLEVLDQTRTSPGARKLRRWILRPLKERGAIERRLASVEALYREQVLLARLREALGSVLDLERLTARVAMDRAHAKDLLAIGATLVAGPFSGSSARSREVRRGPGGDLKRLAEPLGLRKQQMRRPRRRSWHGRSAEEPAIVLTEGNLIRRGYDADLDRLHALKDSARDVLDGYLAEERRKPGIGSLKLRYNRIIGYYFEVTKSYLSLVPAHFIRRQSLVGGERYTTDRLADLESEINNASEKIVEIEKNLFLGVRSIVKEAVPWLLGVSEAVSELDVFQSFAFAATVHGYARPQVSDDGSELSIEEGRHPVVEAHLPGGAFVPNSVSCPAERAVLRHHHGAEHGREVDISAGRSP